MMAKSELSKESQDSSLGQKPGEKTFKDEFIHGQEGEK